MEGDPVGRLFRQWEKYFPENTAETQRKFAEFGWLPDESPSSAYLRLQRLTSQLKDQLGVDAINGPDALRRYRKAIREMDPRLDDFLTRRIMEDEISGRKPPLKSLADELQQRWVTLTRLAMEDKALMTPAKPAMMVEAKEKPPGETRTCHLCGKVGHLRKFCPRATQPAGGEARKERWASEKGFPPHPPAGKWVVSETGVKILEELPQLQRNFPKRELYSPYVTRGVTCDACGRQNHTRDQCFRLHGYPKEFLRYVVPANHAGSTQRPSHTRGGGQAGSQAAYQGPARTTGNSAPYPHVDERFQRLEGVVSEMVAQMERLSTAGGSVVGSSVSQSPVLITWPDSARQPGPSSSQTGSSPDAAWRDGRPGLMVYPSRRAARGPFHPHFQSGSDAYTVGIGDHRREARSQTQRQRQDHPEWQPHPRSFTREGGARGRKVLRSYEPLRISLNPAVGLGLGPVRPQPVQTEGGRIRQQLQRARERRRVNWSDQRQRVERGSSHHPGRNLTGAAAPEQGEEVAEDTNPDRRVGPESCLVEANPWKGVTRVVQAGGVESEALQVTVNLPGEDAGPAEDALTGSESGSQEPSADVTTKHALSAVDRDFDDLTIAFIDNSRGNLALNRFGGFVKPILDTGALPCIITQAALERIPEDVRPKMFKVYSPLQTVSGQIEHPIGETELVEVSFTAGSEVVKRFVPFLVLREGGYEVLLGMSLWKRVYANIDLRLDRVTAYSDLSGLISVEMKLDLWCSPSSMINYVTPAYVGGFAHQNARATDDGHHSAPTARIGSSDSSGSSDEDDEEIVSLTGEALDHYQLWQMELRRENAQELLANAFDDANGAWGEEELPSEPINCGLIRWAENGSPKRVLSLFSGIATDLEAMLAAGLVVDRYWAVERDSVARQVAESRFLQMHRRFPFQLTVEQTNRAHTQLPQDVALVSKRDIEELGRVDLVVAGWPCQGHSRAGGGLGLMDPRSQLFHEMVRILRMVQNTQKEPVGFLLENVHSGEDARPLVQAAWATVTGVLGQPVVLDAAQVGSCAHRVRAYWTNLIPRPWLESAVRLEGRLADLYVDDILDAGRTSAPVTLELPAPFFPCNVVGQRRRALPTLVSFPNSQAYRVGKAGILWDKVKQQWDVPNADERERAMGFPTGTTRCRGVTEEQRRELLGQAMDCNALTWLFLLCLVRQDSLNTHGVCAPFAERLRRRGRARPENIQALIAYLDSKPVLAAVDPSRREWTVGSHLQPDEAEGVRAVLEENAAVFAWTATEIGQYKGSPFTIDLKEEMPIFRKQYRLSFAEQEVVERKTQELVDAGLVVESSSLHGFAAPTVLPPKRDSDGKIVDWRMCGGYRALNQATIPDKYLMQTPEEIFAALGPAQLFSSLDLRQGFNQVPILEAHRHKTAFWAGNRLMEWKFMPFGVRNAPAKFQRVMDETLEGLHFVCCYIDDNLVFSLTTWSICRRCLTG